MIDDQIKRARDATTKTGEIDNKAKELQREGEEKNRLNFQSKAVNTKHPIPIAYDTTPSITTSMPALAPTMSFDTAPINPKNVLATAKKPLPAGKTQHRISNNSRR